MRSILVTGGAGFIGANFVPYFVAKYPECHIINLDKLTYAGNLDNLTECENMVNHTFVKGDIFDEALVQTLFRQHDIRGVIHFAAESHVDNSIKGPKAFMETNVMGTFNFVCTVYRYNINGNICASEQVDNCQTFNFFETIRKKYTCFCHTNTSSFIC